MLPQLNVNINDVDTTVALIPDRTIVPAVVETVEVDENKAKTGHNLIITFATTAPVPESTVPGKPVGPGRKLTNYYPLQASEKQIENGQENMWLERIVQLIDNVLGTEQGNRPTLEEAVEALRGKPVALTVRVESDDQYGDQNRVGRVEPAA